MSNIIEVGKTIETIGKTLQECCFEVKGEFATNTDAVNGGLSVGDVYNLPTNGDNKILSIVFTQPLNRFEYVTGAAPTLQDFEARIGFTLLNGVKNGDIITFDNVNYDIPIEAFSEGQAMTQLTNVISKAITIGDEAFFGQLGLTNPSFNTVESIGDGVFNYCQNLKNPNISNLKNVGYAAFAYCKDLENFNFSNIDNFGHNKSNNNIFHDITGKTITLTAKIIHQTSNNGGLEGDLQYLADNNNVTFIWV